MKKITVTFNEPVKVYHFPTPNRKYVEGYDIENIFNEYYNNTQVGKTILERNFQISKRENN